MNAGIHARFLDGIEKFNDKKFYKCHDILEDVWFDVRGKDRSFYQGLIHLAVGFYHITEKKNSLGANLQLKKGLVKLALYEPSHEGVELTALLKKIERCVKELEKLKGLEIEKFNKLLIPKISIRNS